MTATRKRKQTDARTADLKKIWVGARALGLDKDLLYDLAESLLERSIHDPVKGRRSIGNLNKIERWTIIKELSSKGAFIFRKLEGERPSTQRRAPDPRHSRTRAATTRAGKGTDIVSAKQQAFIIDLWERLEAYEPNASAPAWREAFTYRIISVKYPQKKWEAARLIEALKKRISQCRQGLKP